MSVAISLTTSLTRESWKQKKGARALELIFLRIDPIGVLFELCINFHLLDKLGNY